MADIRIKDIATTASVTDVTSSNYIPLDGASGTKKLPADKLLTTPTSNAAEADFASGSKIPMKVGNDVKWLDAGDVAKESALVKTNAVVSSKLDKDIGKNLFNKNDIVDGKMMNASGVEKTGTNYCISAYMPIESGETYYFVKVENGGDYNVWYDDELNFISSFKCDWNSKTALAPANAKYVRISQLKSRNDDTMVYNGSTAVAYEPYTDIDGINKRFEALENPSILDTYDITNYLLFAKQISGKKYNSSGVLTDNAEWNATELCELDKSRGIYSTFGNCQAYFYNADKEFISYVECRQGYDVSVSQYPENAVYVAFSHYGERADRTLLTKKPSNYLKWFPQTIKRKKNERPRIDIYIADSQDTICRKMADASLTTNCDVYFEHGTYNFDECYVILWETYKARNYIEMPIGGDCRYFFNGSTIIADASSFQNKGYDAVIDALSCIGSYRENLGFELHDLNLKAYGFTYCIHDEGGASGSSAYLYIHKYDNVYSKCFANSHRNPGRNIGGGIGRYGEIELKNSVFDSDGSHGHPIASYHGCYNYAESADAHVRSVGCYYYDTLGLHQLGEKETAHLDFVGNSVKTIPTTTAERGAEGQWSSLSWNNVIHD